MMDDRMSQETGCESLTDAEDGSPIHDGHSVDDRQARRFGRVLDYQTASLAREDALEANLGSINSGLMQIALWLDETISRTIEQGPRTVEQLPAVLPAIDAHLRVTRQVDRFAQIELRAAEARRPAGAHTTGTAPDEPEAEKQSEDSPF